MLPSHIYTFPSMRSESRFTTSTFDVPWVGSTLVCCPPHPYYFPSPRAVAHDPHETFVVHILSGGSRGWWAVTDVHHCSSISNHSLTPQLSACVFIPRACLDLQPMGEHWR